jgi:hypothetical protein
MKTACGDAFADVQARIDAGEITEAEAGAALDEARAGCTAAASSLHDACAPAAPAEPSSLLGGFFGGFFDPSSDDASSSDDAKAACKAAAKAAKSACADGPAKVAADLAAGVITPAEASAAFADAAKACADSGKKIAEACAGPWAPPKEHPEPEPMPLPAAWMRADGADAVGGDGTFAGLDALRLVRRGAREDPRGVRRGRLLEDRRHGNDAEGGGRRVQESREGMRRRGEGRLRVVRLEETRRRKRRRRAAVKK